MMTFGKVLLAFVIGLWAAQSPAEGTVRSVDPDNDADGRVDSAATEIAGVVTEQPAVAASAVSGDGPSIELITGGNSNEGAARVGRMPVLD